MLVSHARYIGEGENRIMSLDEAYRLYKEKKISKVKTFICAEKNCGGSISCACFDQGKAKTYHFRRIGYHACKIEDNVKKNEFKSDSEINHESKVDNSIIEFIPNISNVSSNENKGKIVGKDNKEHTIYRNTIPGNEKSYRHNRKATKIKSIVSTYLENKNPEIKLANGEIIKLKEFVLELNKDNIKNELGSNIKNFINKEETNSSTTCNRLYYLKGYLRRASTSGDNYVVFSNEKINHNGKEKSISIYINDKAFKEILKNKVLKDKEYSFYCLQKILINDKFFTIFINNSSQIYIR